MTRRLTVSLVAVALVLILLASGYFWLRSCFYCDATIYASGFSELKFRRIHRGMSKAEVERILGKPLTGPEGLITDDHAWLYAFLDRSRIPDPDDDRVTNTWFKIRGVKFDHDGRVKDILSSSEQFE